MPRFERKDHAEEITFFEAEQRGNTVFFATGGAHRPTRQRQRVCAGEEEAYAVLAEEIRKKRYSGYLFTGAPEELDRALPPQVASSALLIDVYFAAEDERFLGEVLEFEGSMKLAALADSWLTDARPFARRMLLAYIDDGCDRNGHKPLVKRLFKRAESAGDDVVMAHFMVAFDRWNRRHVTTVGWDWDPQTRKTNPRLGLLHDPMLTARLGRKENEPRFTRATRSYLARRAFRYFRRLGYRDEARYRRSVALALGLYQDVHLSSVGRLLSAWGLLHVLYGRSAVLVRAPSGIRVADGKTLAELVPEPMFPAAWKGAFDDVVHLLSRGASRTVRAWALALVRRDYSEALSALSIATVKELILSSHEEPQLLGVELLGKLRGLESLSISEWLELLGTKNLELLSAVCDHAQGYVSARRLTLAQCVDIALSPAAPLAALGLAWSKEKKIASDADVRELLRLAKAPVAGVRADGAKYCAKLLAELPFIRTAHVRELVDAPFADARAAGLHCVSLRFSDDQDLWLSLCESPYPDVRSAVIARAKTFRLQTNASALATVFGSVMLSLHGAGADKRRVTRELTERVAQKPDEAEALMPLLSALLRSIHPAERRMSLAALAATAVHVPGVRQLVEKRFPELRIAAEVSE